MTSALSALERASSERSRVEAGCRGCVPCLFQDCGQLSGSCCTYNITLTSILIAEPPLSLFSQCLYRMIWWYPDQDLHFFHPTASPASALSEPSCDVISKAQKLQDEAQRSWALSQACAYYQHRCPPGELDKESCIRIMGESCSARVLQCSLLNTMQNLEPATQTHAQGKKIGVIAKIYMLSYMLICLFTKRIVSWPSVFLCPCSGVRSEVGRRAKRHSASLQDCGRLPCSSRQLALAGQPAARWRPDVRRGPGGQLLGGYCCTLLCRVSDMCDSNCSRDFILSVAFEMIVQFLFSPPHSLLFSLFPPHKQSQWELLDGRSGGVWHHQDWPWWTSCQSEPHHPSSQGNNCP